MKLVKISRFSNFDWWIMLIGLFLIIIGLATIYSLEINQLPQDFINFEHQIFAAFLGAVFFILLIFFDFRALFDYVHILYVFGIVMLILVLIFGVTIRGTTGWFSIASFTFQPIEAFKLVFILALAKFAVMSKNINNPLTLITSFIFIIPPVFLVYLQPDIGSIFVLIAIFLGLIFIIRLKFWYIVLFLISAALFSLIAWQFLLAPYQKNRIITFINPDYDTADSGYNVHQSKIAVGSGRLLGRGFGLGSQSSLNFLPEQETDFIFAVISESLGIFGSILVIFLYSFLLWRMLRLTCAIADEFGSLVSLGIFFWFSFQGFSNIAMNLGLAPIFGVPLPFVSYGGSSLLAAMIALGILESISIYSPRYATK